MYKIAFSTLPTIDMGLARVYLYLYLSNVMPRVRSKYSCVLVQNFEAWQGMLIMIILMDIAIDQHELYATYVCTVARSTSS